MIELKKFRQPTAQELNMTEDEWANYMIECWERFNIKSATVSDGPWSFTFTTGPGLEELGKPEF